MSDLAVGVTKYCELFLGILAQIFFKIATIYSYSNDCSPSRQFCIDVNILQNHRCAKKDSIGGGKGGARGLKPLLISRVLHRIQFFTIEIFLVD